MSGFRHHRHVWGITEKLNPGRYSYGMTKGLVRYYGAAHLHFITCSCYRRQPQLHTARRRDLFLRILEETRCKYRFVVHGYVVMPEHFHLLITEPEVGDPSVVMKVVKQRFARRLNQLRNRTALAQIALWNCSPDPVWQKRFYDFNVWSERKRIEKLRYMHRNPVKRGLVEQPDQWKWSSFRARVARPIAKRRAGMLQRQCSAVTAQSSQTSLISPHAVGTEALSADSPASFCNF